MLRKENSQTDGHLTGRDLNVRMILRDVEG